MTTQDIHYYIEQGLQRMGYYMHDHFFPQEIDLHINKIIRDYVKIMHARKEYSKIQTLFKTQFDQQSTYPPDTEYLQITFEKDFFLYNSGSVRANISDCGTVTDNSPVKALPILIKDSFQEDVLRVNPYATTSIKKILGFRYSNGLKLYTDKKIIIKGVFIIYTCIPKELTLNLPEEEPDLPVETHDQIADLVVDHLKRIIESSQQNVPPSN